MGSGVRAPPFLTLAIDGVEVKGSHPGRFTPGEIASGTHWIGGWVDSVEKRKILPPTGINPLL
jgi:hypothetical protein